MQSALIGYTGFVGSNLMEQRNFSALYNSRNILDVRGKSYDEVICAGVPAVKWWANLHPEEDIQNIRFMLASLREIETDRLVVISTVDVYSKPIAADEDHFPDRSSLTPYGKHRLEVEEFLSNHFAGRCTILRLPALFGNHLKKNVLFDLLNNNMIENINPASSFQWYPLKRLASDIDTAVENGIDIVNIATEPLCTADIVTLYFPHLLKIRNNVNYPPVCYDFWTKYASEYGKASGNYIMSKDEVLKEMSSFILSSRRAAS